MLPTLIKELVLCIMFFKRSCVEFLLFIEQSFFEMSYKIILLPRRLLERWNRLRRSGSRTVFHAFVPLSRVRLRGQTSLLRRLRASLALPVCRFTACLHWLCHARRAWHRVERQSRRCQPWRARLERRKRDRSLLHGGRDAGSNAKSRLHGPELRVRDDVVKAGAVQCGGHGGLAVLGFLAQTNVGGGVG